MDELRGEYGTRCANRMALSDGAALDVDNVIWKSKLPRDHDSNRREGFVDLDALDRVRFPTSALQRLPHRGDWPEAEHAGLDRGDAVGNEARRRGEAAFVRPRRVGKHHRGSGVV